MLALFKRKWNANVDDDDVRPSSSPPGLLDLNEDLQRMIMNYIGDDVTSIDNLRRTSAALYNAVDMGREAKARFRRLNAEVEGAARDVLGALPTRTELAPFLFSSGRARGTSPVVPACVALIAEWAVNPLGQSEASIQAQAEGDLQVGWTRWSRWPGANDAWLPRLRAAAGRLAEVLGSTRERGRAPMCRCIADNGRDLWRRLRTALVGLELLDPAWNPWVTAAFHELALSPLGSPTRVASAAERALALVRNFGIEDSIVGSPAWIGRGTPAARDADVVRRLTRVWRDAVVALGDIPDAFGLAARDCTHYGEVPTARQRRLEPRGTPPGSARQRR